MGEAALRIDRKTHLVRLRGCGFSAKHGARAAILLTGGAYDIAIEDTNIESYGTLCVEAEDGVEHVRIRDSWLAHEGGPVRGKTDTWKLEGNKVTRVGRQK